jgi:hypothetical protein
MGTAPIEIILEASMIQRLRIGLARWILGKHCGCYAMGYHKLCDYSKRTKK